MPISLKWDDDNQTILRLTFRDKWDLEAYQQQCDAIIDTIKPLAQTVDVLVDLRSDLFVPIGNVLQIFRHFMDRLPENTGLIVYVSDNPAQSHMYNTQMSFYYALRPRQKRRLHMVATVAEAYTLINTTRAQN